MKTVIGACLGASSISIVKIKRSKSGEIEIEDRVWLPHNGSPRKLFLENIEKINPEKFSIAITGRKFRNLVNLTSISEPEATEYALSFVNKNNEKYSAIASLGGETFIVYTLDDEGKIANIITKNQCASGTGEFFLQQIKRMDLGLEEVIEISRGAEPFHVSGRCSVFCKSDCTHALNKGTPKSEVASGLALMMADKVEELLKKAGSGRAMVVGGVTRNYSVIDFLKQKFPDIYIPEEAPYFEALGAALYALEYDVVPIDSYDKIFIKNESSFVFHQPLINFKEKVTFKTFEKGTARAGDVCILGLDVGSTTTKAVLFRISDDSILASVYLYTLGDPVKASRKCYAELLKQIPDDIKIIGLGVTGSGRQIAGLHGLTEGVINEIVAHAAAAVYFDEEVDTIFEIGGQDAKYSYIVNKIPADYAMNEACSAGTGSFIEESAYESLGIDVTEIEPIAMEGMSPPNFNDQCAAFINSDIKTALQENISREDIVAGLVYSICLNYINRVKGNRPVGKKIFMQGGVCYNKAIPIAMAALTGKDIIVPPEPGLMGAFGVALALKEKIALGLIKEKSYSLKELVEREVIYHPSFICKGGREKCDRTCTINIIEVDGKKYPFGGACDKYYNIRYKYKIDAEKYDFVKKRQQLIFEKYAPAAALPEGAKTIGINKSFHTHTIYPLFYNFFTGLGFKVILSENVIEEGMEREFTSFCYPAQLSLGLFRDLLDKKPDYYFVPNIFEMYVEDADYHRLDFNCTCVFVSGEPLFLKQAFKDFGLNDRIIAPHLNFANGFHSQEESFVKIAEELGVKDRSLASKAFTHALNMQKEFTDELFRMGAEFLEFLERNPNEFAIVLVGRPYNAFTSEANKGIPQKFASRGVYVVPFDMFDYRSETVDDSQYWEGGKKILKIAKIIKRHPQLFATYISNFSCGPDSMLMTTFRSIMGAKPSLTLELDGHTADAGINTRIDAALDIIKNYIKINQLVIEPDYSDFIHAKIELGNNTGYFISSDGERMPLTDSGIDILIPSMGDIAAELFAAGLRSQGFNAIALPEDTPEVLKFARANASGKECLPLLLLTGALLNYIENIWDGRQYIAFFIVQGAGNCRLGQYPVFLRELIKRKKLRNVATLILMNEDGFAGLGPDFARRGMRMILASDVLDDIRSAIMANSVDPESGLQVFNNELKKLVEVAESAPNGLLRALRDFSKIIKEKAPSRVNIKDSKYIALLGEIYVRRDHFAHRYLNKLFAKKGFIIKDAYISEWIFYVDYLIGKKLLEPEASWRNRVERRIRQVFMRYDERRIKKILAHSGYYKYFKTVIAPLLNHSKHIIPLEFKGEPGLTLGITLHETIEKYCGVINLGPFGCMPTRLAEAVSVPETKIGNKIYAKRLNDSSYSLPEQFKPGMNIPFLTLETDGNVYPQIIEAKLETFTLQAGRLAELMKTLRNGNG